MLDLHAIQRECDLVLTSGLSAVSLIDPNDLVKTPVIHLVPSVLELEFKPGKAAFGIDYKGFSARIQDKNTYQAGNGDVYEYEVSFTVPGVAVDREYLRAKLRNRKVHALCTYQSGNKRFVPGLRWTVTGDSGDSSSANGYNFKGLAQMLKPAPFLNAEVNVIGPPYTPPATGGGSGSTAMEVIEATTTYDSYTYTLPAGRLLVAIFVRSTTAQAVSIGYSAGTSELAGPNEQAALEKVKYGDNWILATTNTNIYITGLAGINTIEICIL